MKILICGLGSVGKRHLCNLLKLGYKKKDIIMFRSYKGQKKSNINGIKTFYNLDKALIEKPQVAIISNPTHLHLKTAIKCAKKKMDIFIEKPLTNSRKNLYQIQKIQKKNNNKIMIGYMMRFHPIIKKIKNLLKKNYIGKVYHFKMHWGEFLPNWHKNENYKKSYAANKSMGGGVALTLSHDLDLSNYLFGKIKKCFKVKNNTKILKIRAEEIADFLLIHEKNVIGNIHLDYLQKKPERFIKIYGTNGKLEMNYYNSSLVISKKNKESVLKFNKFQRNHLFIEEMKYFFKCIKQKINPRPGLNDSIYLLNKTSLI